MVNYISAIKKNKKVARLIIGNADKQLATKDMNKQYLRDFINKLENIEKELIE